MPENDELNKELKDAVTTTMKILKSHEKMTIGQFGNTLLIKECAA